MINQSIWHHWEQLAKDKANSEAIIHWVSGEEPFRWNFSDLINRANYYSSLLLSKGIKPGEVCAIIIRHNPEFYPLYLGVVGMGALPAVLAYPNPRLHPEKFRQGLLGMTQKSGLDWVLTEKELHHLFGNIVKAEGSTIKDIIFPIEENISIDNNKYSSQLKKIRVSFNPDDPVLLQHSSGTTGLQKPVILTHYDILKHVEQYGEALELNENDKFVSWTPLYHDMGLIGTFHLPLAFGIPTVQINTFEWILAPGILFEAISKEKTTITLKPNFAFNLLTNKVKDEDMEGIDLSSMRLFINAAEPIRHDTMERFIKRFKKYGLNELAPTTQYGMAETTLAVVQTPPGKKYKILEVDRQKLANGVVEIANENTKVKRVCVSSGVLLKECEMKIVDDNRNPLPELTLGEIAVKSASQFKGYRNYPEKTAKVIDSEGWYYTSDYGFIFENELYVIGRKDDIIIVAGNNIYPEDIEDAVNQVEGVQKGRVIAFGEINEELGTEVISVIAETKIENEDEKKKLIIEIKKAGMSIDIPITNVYLVPPRWLIKSSAGKPSRKANSQRILELKNMKG
uniref:AMP-dependent synthetase/ligase domain-containing protein n=1 Tax=Ignavibacterium album TaxID=591197 RepID=A0A832CWV6_9BACT